LFIEGGKSRLAETPCKKFLSPSYWPEKRELAKGEIQGRIKWCLTGKKARGSTPGFEGITRREEGRRIPST